MYREREREKTRRKKRANWINNPARAHHSEPIHQKSRATSRGTSRELRKAKKNDENEKKITKKMKKSGEGRYVISITRLVWIFLLRVLTSTTNDREPERKQTVRTVTSTSRRRTRRRKGSIASRRSTVGRQISPIGGGLWIGNWRRRRDNRSINHWSSPSMMFILFACLFRRFWGLVCLRAEIAARAIIGRFCCVMKSRFEVGGN